jgi:hypothetical protein
MKLFLCVLWHHGHTLLLVASMRGSEIGKPASCSRLRPASRLQTSFGGAFYIPRPPLGCLGCLCPFVMTDIRRRVPINPSHSPDLSYDTQCLLHTVHLIIYWRLRSSLSSEDLHTLICTLGNAFSVRKGLIYPQSLAPADPFEVIADPQYPERLWLPDRVS